MFTAWYKKTAQHDLHGERFVYFIFLTDFKFRFKIGVIGKKLQYFQTLLLNLN